MSRSTSRSHSLSVTTQLVVTLQFLATDIFQTVVASALGISQPSVSNCVRGVTDALCSITKDYIQFPTAARQMSMQHGFMEKFGFPKVLGCIDGSQSLHLAPTKQFMLTVKVIIQLTSKRYVTMYSSLLM